MRDKGVGWYLPYRYHIMVVSTKTPHRVMVAH